MILAWWCLGHSVTPCYAIPPMKSKTAIRGPQNDKKVRGEVNPMFLDSLMNFTKIKFFLRLFLLLEMQISKIAARGFKNLVLVLATPVSFYLIDFFYFCIPL